MERFLDTDLHDWEPVDRYKDVYCCNPDKSRKPVPVPDTIRFRQDQPFTECDESNECKCRKCRCQSCIKRSQPTSAKSYSKGPCGKTRPNPVGSTFRLQDFDAAMKAALNKKRFPRIEEDERADQLESGILHPILARSIRRGFPMEESSPPASGVEVDSKLKTVAQKFSEMDRVYRYEMTLRAAEKAAQMAPPDRREEAALAGAQDYSINVTERRSVQEEPDCVIEVVSYIGVTRPCQDELNEQNN